MLRKLMMAGSLVAAVLFMLVRSTPSAPTTDVFHPDHVIEDPLQGKIDIIGEPLSGQPLTITFSVIPVVDVPAAEITLEFPQSLVFVSGATHWQGDLVAGKTLALAAVVRPAQSGQVFLRVGVQASGEFPILQGYSHALVVDGSITGQELSLEFPVESQAIQLETPAAANVGIATATTVTGTIQYQVDSGSKYPVKSARVELWEDLATDVLLADGITSSSGNFSFTIDIAAAKNVYVKVYCQSAAVICKNGGGSVYSLSTGAKSITPGAANAFGTWYAEYAMDVWEAYDAVLKEYDWVAAQSGTGWTRSQVTVKWPVQCPTNPPIWWPCSDGNTLYFPAQADVMWTQSTALHEYGHAVMFAAYSYFPYDCNIGTHYVNSESCETFALTEGFAEFMEAAVINSPAGLQGGNCGTGNIETNNWELGRDCSANNSGGIVEGAVASVWWDILDPSNYPSGESGDRDSLALGFDEIWTVMRLDKPNGISAFWSKWFTRYAYKPEMNLIYYDHGIDKNTAPAAASEPSPANSVTGVATSAALGWVGSDPEGDSLKYNVYFGASSTPPLVASNLAAATYNPGALAACQMYYWKIVSTDPFGKQSTGPLWSFTTTCLPGVFSKMAPANLAGAQFLSINFTWNTSANVTRYTFCLDKVNNNTCDTGWANTSSATNWVVNGLDASTTYYWQVQAKNASGTTNANEGVWWSFTTGTSAGVPVNDSLDTPQVIPSVPVTITLDTTQATKAVDDPDLTGCSRAAGNASVWYKFTSGKNGTLVLSTEGSDYDTMLGSWSGTRGSLVELGCNDDATASSLQSLLNQPVLVGNTYIFGASQMTTIKPSQQVSPQTGGSLHLGVTLKDTYTFVDVPRTDSGWSFVEALYANGITSGCGGTPLQYCPGNTLTRGQMSVFILRAKYGAAYAPPAASGTMFTDVPLSNSYAAWIEKAVTDGIAIACGDGKFCPGDAVTRVQMAYWLLRGKYGSGYMPPAAIGRFSDVPASSPDAPWIEKIYVDGITSGCGGGKFCPTNPVTRWQMAVFLTRTFSLPIPTLP